MNKKDVPQDHSAIENISRELYYVKNCDGKYDTELSTGWEIKKIALDITWEEIKSKTHEAIYLIKEGEKSPLWYFMQIKLMDLSILSAYTGFWKFSIKRHLKPRVFKKLNKKKLNTYANAFDITLEELNNFKI